MRILIRCDIGGRAGMGRASRMRALAWALRTRGAEVRFTTTTPALARFALPFTIELGEQPYYLRQRHYVPDIFVVDTAHETEEYQWLGLRQYFRVVRIDILAKPETCDLFIMPNAHQSPLTITRLETDFPGCVLHGWDYVMLDAEVTQQAPISYATRQDSPIVFCAGGSDPDGTLERMYDWAVDLDIPTQLLFCFGTASQGILRQRYEAQDGESLCTSGNRYIMPFARRYLRQAALVVGMFGQTTYECLWYQMPMLSLARNKEDSCCAQRLQHSTRGAVQSGLQFAYHTEKSFCRTVFAYWHDVQERQRMHAASIGLFDGRGTERVADAIMQLGA